MSCYKLFIKTFKSLKNSLSFSMQMQMQMQMQISKYTNIQISKIRRKNVAIFHFNTKISKS